MHKLKAVRITLLDNKVMEGCELTHKTAQSIISHYSINRKSNRQTTGRTEIPNIKQLPGDQ